MGYAGGDAHLMLHDATSGWLSVRRISGFDTSEELYDDRDWPAGFAVVRRMAPLAGGTGQHYLFYRPDTGRMEVHEFTLGAGGPSLAQRQQWEDPSLAGWADVVPVTRTSIAEQTTHLLLLSGNRTSVHIRRITDPRRTVWERPLGGRAQRLLPGRYDANPTGDDVLVQLPPNAAEAPASHVFAVYVADGDDQLRRAANTLVGRPLAGLTTVPLTVGGRSEIVGLDPVSGDILVYDTDDTGHAFGIGWHRGAAVGWQQVLYVPDLTRTDPDWQPGRSLLLYRRG